MEIITIMTSTNEMIQLVCDKCGWFQSKDDWSSTKRVCVNDRCRAPGKHLVMAYENEDAYGRDTETIIKTYGLDATQEKELLDNDAILKIENKERLGSLMEMDGGESDDIHPIGWKGWTDKMAALGIQGMEYNPKACRNPIKAALTSGDWSKYEDNMTGSLMEMNGRLQKATVRQVGEMVPCRHPVQIRKVPEPEIEESEFPDAAVRQRRERRMRKPTYVNVGQASPLWYRLKPTVYEMVYPGKTVMAKGKPMELPCQCARCLFETAEHANKKLFNNGKADPWALNRDSRGRLTTDSIMASEYQSLKSLGDEMIGFEQLDPLLSDVEYSRVAKPTPIHINIPDERINEYMESREKALKNAENKAWRELKEELLVAKGGKPSDTISVETLKWYKIWTRKENLVIKAAYSGLEWVEDGSLAIPDKMNEQKAKAFLWDIRTVDPVSAVAKHYVPLL